MVFSLIAGAFYANLNAARGAFNVVKFFAIRRKVWMQVCRIVCFGRMQGMTCMFFQ